MPVPGDEGGVRGLARLAHPHVVVIYQVGQLDGRVYVAMEYVAGYSVGHDVSARDWQKDFGGGQWCRGKTFDTFAPLGPALVLRDEIPNPNALGIRTILNGQTMQDWNTQEPMPS